MKKNIPLILALSMIFILISNTVTFAQEFETEVKTEAEQLILESEHEHSFGPYVTTKEATVFECGNETRSCTECGAAENRVIEKLLPTIELNTDSVTLKKGQKFQIMVKTSPGDAVAKWESSNSLIATITASGIITAKKAGAAKITITLMSGLTKTIKVTVTNSSGNETETESEIDTETESETNVETDSETNAETESEVNIETESETNAETEFKIDTETDTETEFGHMHNYQLVISKKPTCMENGSCYKECSICHVKRENSDEIIPALGHTGGLATCSAKAVCSRCGEAYGKLSTTHSYGEYTVSKKPTALDEGIETRSCLICGIVENRVIKKLPATMKLNATSIKLKMKQSTNNVKVVGLAAGDAVAFWKSSNPGIVTVNKHGKITAKSKKGKATVTITLKSGLSKTIRVTVQEKEVSCTKVTLNTKTITLKKNASFSLKPNVKPITCIQKVKYKSSDTSIATVSASGRITAKKKGAATITVTVGKKKATCKVKVK